jgi:hypothetical protein
VAGPTGATGPAGAQGATGPQGVQGATGPAGNGVPIGGAVYQRLVKNSATNYDTKWTGPDVFNVMDYGATGLGDAGHDDTAAIQNAANALTTRGYGCLFFPQGRYYISAQIQVGTGLTYGGGAGVPFNANFCVRGTGRFSSVIIQSSTSGNGIYSLLSGGGAQGQGYNRIEVCDLGFRVPNGATTTGAAIYIDYGSITMNSDEPPCGPEIHGIDIGQDAINNTGGYTNGIVVNTPWKVHIYDINGYGGNGASVPTSGAGSGSLIDCIGGTNIIVSDIYGSFWQYGVQLAQSPGGNGEQGFMSANVILVAVRRGLWVAAGNYFTNIQVANWLVDQGNSANAGLANVAFYIDGDPTHSALRGACTFTGCSFTQVVGVSISCGFYLNNVNYSSFLGCNGYASGTSGWCVLAGVCDYNVFSACVYGSGGVYNSIVVGASCTNNYFNNIQGSTFSNSGGATNKAITTLF